MKKINNNVNYNQDDLFSLKFLKILNKSKKYFQLLLIITLLFSPFVYAENWQLIKEKEGIQLFTKNTSNSSLKAFKGVISIPTHLSAIITTINDTSVHSHLFPYNKKMQVIKQISATESYRYIVTSLPWPAKSRDSIVYTVLKQNKTTKTIQITLNGVPNYIPVKPNLIRIKKLSGRWLLVPEKDSVKVVYEMHIDPAGNLPTWFVNNLLIDLPFMTLSNLRKLVKQPKYQKAKLSF